MRNGPRLRHLPDLPCACASLRRAARAVTQLYDEALRPTGMRITQFTLLKTLASAGPLRQGELGNLLALDSTTLTRTLAPLKAAGWIEIRSGEDRRERLVELTAAGHQQMVRGEEGWAEAQRRMRRALGEKDWKRLFGLSWRVAGAAQRD